MPGSGPGGRWFQSIRPRPSLLELINLQAHEIGEDRPGVGPGGLGSNRIAPTTLFPFSHRLTLRCVMFSNWLKLSNLSIHLSAHALFVALSIAARPLARCIFLLS